MNTSWYLTRAAGIVAWALLALSVLWGLMLSTKLFRTRPRPAWTLDLHRFLGGAALAFTLIHLLALLADSYVHFGAAELLVPLMSEWHPVAVAWGIVALYLLIAIELTSLLMRHLSNRIWKGVHRLSFGLFVIASIHAASAGTDLGGRAAIVNGILFSGVVSLLWLVRILSPRRALRSPRRERVHRDEGVAGAPDRADDLGERVGVQR